MEKVEFLQKQIELGQSSQNSLARLRSIGAEVAGFYAHIVSHFPLFFGILSKAIIQELVFARAISKIRLSRFDLFFSHNLLTEGKPRDDEDRLEPENMVPLVSVMLDSTLTQKLRPRVIEPQIGQTPKSNGSKASSVLVKEPKEKRWEEPAERTPVITTFTQWQTEIANKISPNISNVLARVDFQKKATIISALYATMSAAVLISPADLNIATYRALEPTPSEAPFTEKRIAPSTIIEKSALGKTRETRAVKEPAAKTQKVSAAIRTIATMAAIAQSISAMPQITTTTAQPAITTYRALETVPPEEAFKEKVTPVSELWNLSSGKEESREVQSSPSLSTVVWRLSPGVLSTISEQQKPFFEIAEILSQYSSVPTASSFPMFEPPSVFPVSESSLASILPAKVNLSLHEVASSLTSWIYEGAENLRSTGVPLSAVPIAASEAEKVVNETLTNATPKSWVAEPQVEGAAEGEQERLSTLPTVLALAGAGSLINQRLQSALTTLRKESKVNQQYAEMNSLGTSGIQKISSQTSVRDRLMVQYPIEPKVNAATSVLRPPRSRITRFPAQDNIDVKSSDEDSEEEDLSDLERKISKILSEQLSRYYGTSKL